MKQYNIIHINFTLPSFNWASGLYAIIGEKDGIYNMCKIDETGAPQLFDDGRFMISCTGVNNPGITKTNLILTH